MVGIGELLKQIKNKVRKLGIEDKVLFLGVRKDVNKLYSAFDLFIFPSLFEGFGLPVLEAMYKGLPVICSDSSSIPEGGGKAALYFNPREPKELAMQLEKLIHSGTLREEMVRKSLEQVNSFKMEQMVEKTLECINSLGRKISDE